MIASIYVRPIAITSRAGEVTTHRASTIGGALDLRAIGAGYTSWDDACAKEGTDPNDWTQNRAEFNAGAFGALVEYA